MSRLGIIVSSVILGIGTIITGALITAGFIYLGWNYGIRAALPNAGLGEISLLNAWCIGVFICSIGGALRTGVETKTS